MPGRIVPIVNNEIYHVFNRGSDKRNIFLQPRDYRRFIKTFYYYQFEGPKPKLSNLTKDNINSFKPTPSARLIEPICYCLMPNHFHFLLRQLKDNGTSIFISQVSNSYTKCFNTKYKRIGPLLQGVFKAVRIETDEQLIHVSRYIHLNPVVSGIVDDPEMYLWSSYSEYANGKSNLCSIEPILNLFSSKEEYCKFVKERIDYGKALEAIKHQIIDDDLQ